MNNKSGAFGLVFFFLLSATFCFGQNLLSKTISLDVNQQRLDNVLEILSNKGDFYFSYNSGIIKKDSIVSLSVSNKTVKEVLTLLLNNTYEFRQSGNYIIIRKAPIRVTLVTQQVPTSEKIYNVAGFVYDEQSGIPLNEASIYEKKLLAATLSNNDGSFRLRLKSSKSSAATLNISKEFYRDTSVVIQPKFNQQVTVTLVPEENFGNNITISPLDYLLPDSVKKTIQFDSLIENDIYSQTNFNKVEKTEMGRFLLSSRQKAQSLNLRKFFIEKPFQVSFTPELSTHGKLSPQVVNKISINLLGGYTGGTDGLEIGGLFNIDKKNVRLFQAAGVFNMVGGKLNGVQIAGVNNTVLDSVKGFQAAGVNNHVKGSFHGLQLAGVYNHVSDSVKGYQISGVGNFAKGKINGGQIAGVANFSNRETKGIQIAGVINYAKKLKGIQIGLINITDSSEGYSIGLINVSLKGYHKLSFSANEVMNVNASFKSGNRKLYSILQAGLNTADSNRIYGFGYGLGSDLSLNKKKNFYFNPEIISQYLYSGTWDYLNLLNRAQLHLNFKINKFISVYAGPCYSVYISDQSAGVQGYQYPVPKSSYKTTSFSNRVTGWFGWNAGINIF